MKILPVGASVGRRINTKLLNFGRHFTSRNSSWLFPRQRCIDGANWWARSSLPCPKQQCSFCGVFIKKNNIGWTSSKLNPLGLTHYLPKSPPNPPILGEPEFSPPKVGGLGGLVRKSYPLGLTHYLPKSPLTPQF